MKQTLLYIIFFLLPFSSHAANPSNDVLMSIDALEQENRVSLLVDLVIVESAIFSMENAQFVNKYFGFNDESQIAFSLPVTIARNMTFGAAGYGLVKSVQKMSKENVAWFVEYDALKKAQLASAENIKIVSRTLDKIERLYPNSINRAKRLEKHELAYAAIGRELKAKLTTRPGHWVRAWSAAKGVLRLTSKATLVVGSVVFAAATWEESRVLWLGSEVVNESLISLREDRARLEAALYPEQ